MIVVDSVGVTPDGLRSTAVFLAEVSAGMKQVLSSLNGELDAVGRPWGDDDAGRQFADGAGGYVAQREWVSGSVEAKTSLLDGYAEALRTAADTLEGQDGA